MPQSTSLRDISRKTPVACSTLKNKLHKADPRIHLRMGSPGHLCKTLLLGTCMVLVSHAGTVRKNHLTLERKPKDSLWNPGSEVCMTHYATPTNIQVLMRHIHPGKPVRQIFHICDIQKIDGFDKILLNKDKHGIQQKSHFPFLLNPMKIKSVCFPSESTCIEITFVKFFTFIYCSS